jgi:hypothetical protein
MKPLAKGDRVRIIGGSIGNDYRHQGETFEINAILITGDVPYNPFDGIYYPPTSLELVEEFQIGDEVEVIGPAKLGSIDQIGMRFIIDKETTEGFTNSDMHMYNYPASSLRKVRPDRLAAIEKQLADQKNANSKIRKRLHVLEEHDMNLMERITRLEAWQKEQTETTYLKRLVLLSGGQRSGKLAELTPPEPKVVARILDEPEIQVGDWVEVQSDGCGKKKGFIFCVGYIKTEQRTFGGSDTYYSANNLPMWTADELRLLSRDEIAARLNGGQP